jgi:hypothetical protein
MGSSLYLSGGVQNTSKLVKTFAVANSFAVGDVVRYDVGSTSFVKAQADSATNSEVVGVVSEASAGSFSVVYSGEIDLTSVSTLSGFSGPVLFLASSVAGGLTSNPPSAIGSVVKPLVVRNASTNQYVVTNFLGTQIGGSSTVAIDEIQPVGTIMPFAGSVIPDSWLECNGNSYAVGTYPNLYAKLQNSSGDRVPAYGYVAEIGVNTTTYATWFSAVAVGDRILYSSTLSDIGSGSTSPVTTYLLIGKVLAKGTSSITVQMYPKYNATTKNFVFPNVIPSTVGWLAAFAPAASGIIDDSLTSANRRADAVSQPQAAVSTVSVTHFNTPDLRGRFALGVNASALGELETDSANYSAISGIYSLGSEGGQEATVVDTAGVLTGTTNTKFTTTSSSSTGTIANMPPYTVVRYIIKATPYTRAAIIDGLDLPYSNLLVGDLRDGALRPGGSGEDLLFKTNNGSGGTERMRLSNAGRLGIGTTTPLAIVDVTTPSNTWAFTYGTSSAHSYIGTDTSNNSVLNAWSGHVLQCGGTEKLRLTSTGDLGIGTSSPGYTLDLTTNGTARLGSAIITPASTTISSTNIFTTGSGGLAIGSSTTPTAKVEIYGADGTKQGLFVSMSGTDAASVSTTLATMWTRAPVHLKMAGASNNRLLFGGVGSQITGIQSSSYSISAGALDMALQPYGGKVGIGDTAPTYTLDVSGGSTDMLRLKSTQTNSLVRFQDAGTSTTPQVGSSGNDLLLRTNGTDRVRITETGVGVSKIWIPTFQNISFPKNGSASQSAGTEFQGLATYITSPGTSSERYTLVVLATNFNYNPGDIFSWQGTYDDVPGHAQVVISQGGYVYSINGSTTTAPANGAGNVLGYRSTMVAIWYRTT